MSESGSLAIFSRAAQMLAEADTIQKTKELKSLALTAADFARRKGMGEEAIQHCRGYALEAERRMGEMLAAAELNRGTAGQGRPKKGGNAIEPPKDETPTLAELGVSKRESSEAQALASLPIEAFEEVKSGRKSKAQARREVAKKKVVEKVAALPSDKFRIIYADPPWKYGDQLTEDYGPTRFHYPAMTINELCALPVSDLCEENAVLFLWVTSPLLFECAPLLPAWGFKYKTSFVWDKVKHNMGHYNSVRHELLLVCTRGSCTPDVPKLFDSVQSIERSKKHSEKPEAFRQIIETLYPHGKRLEMFARAEAKGWERWGNQA